MIIVIMIVIITNFYKILCFYLCHMHQQYAWIMYLYKHINPHFYNTAFMMNGTQWKKLPRCCIMIFMWQVNDFTGKTSFLTYEITLHLWLNWDKIHRAEVGKKTVNQEENSRCEGYWEQNQLMFMRKVAGVSKHLRTLEPEAGTSGRDK